MEEWPAAPKKMPPPPLWRRGQVNRAAGEELPFRSRRSPPSPRSAAGRHPGFLATAAMMRFTISSSVRYGDFSAGRSDMGISSMRYTVPGALTPETAVVKWTRAQPARVRHLRIEHDGRRPLEVLDRRLRHRRARIGAEHERRVVVAAHQHVDRRELSGIEAGIAAAQIDAERIARSSSGARRRRRSRCRGRASACRRTS